MVAQGKLRAYIASPICRLSEKHRNGFSHVEVNLKPPVEHLYWSVVIVLLNCFFSIIQTRARAAATSRSAASLLMSGECTDDNHWQRALRSLAICRVPRSPRHGDYPGDTTDDLYVSACSVTLSAFHHQICLKPKAVSSRTHFSFSPLSLPLPHSCNTCHAHTSCACHTIGLNKLIVEQTAALLSHHYETVLWQQLPWVLSNLPGAPP